MSRRLLACAAAVVSAVPFAAPAAARPRAPHPPALSAGAAILYEPSTGKVLYAKRAYAPHAIASVTKLMTARVTLEHARLNRTFTAPPYGAAAVESQIGLRTGERMRVSDLLTAAMLPSANDAAYDLAVNVGGSRTRFVALMNREARRLHLTHTHYSTPVGLDDPANYSSPYDLARLAGLLERNRFFARTVDRPAATLTSGDHPRTVVNRNTLVRRVPWVNGVKTGHTLDAGYCLVASGKRGRLRLISVVLGTPSESARDADALRLLRYGYANWRLVRLVRRGEVVAHRRVHDKDDLRIAVLARRSVTRLLRRDQPIALTQNVPGELTGPLPRGALVGQLVFHSQGRVLARVPLVTARAVPAVHPGEKVARFLGRPGTLIPLMAAVVTGAAIVVSRRRRAQRRRRRADVETAA